MLNAIQWLKLIQKIVERYSEWTQFDSWAQLESPTHLGRPHTCAFAYPRLIAPRLLRCNFHLIKYYKNPLPPSDLNPETMTLSDDEDDNLAQFLESEVLAQASDSEVQFVLHNHYEYDVVSSPLYHPFFL